MLATTTHRSRHFGLGTVHSNASDPPYNKPESEIAQDYSPLHKRVPPAIDFNHYVCKGRTYLNNMRIVTSDPLEWSYDDLVKNDWQVHPTADTEGLAPAILDVMEDLGIPLEDEDNLLLTLS